MRVLTIGTKSMKTDSKQATEFEVDYKKNYLSIPSIILFPGKNSLTPVKSAKVILQILIKTKHIGARGIEIDRLSISQTFRFANNFSQFGKSFKNLVKL